MRLRRIQHRETGALDDSTGNELDTPPGKKLELCQARRGGRSREPAPERRRTRRSPTLERPGSSFGAGSPAAAASSRWHSTAASKEPSPPPSRRLVRHRQRSASPTDAGSGAHSVPESTARVTLYRYSPAFSTFTRS